MAIGLIDRSTNNNMKLIRVIQSKIVKKDNKYQVQSEKGRNLGTYDTKEKAEKRLKQVEMFKHMKKKSKLFTYDELNKWTEEKFREQGFPTDEQLKDQYNKFMYSYNNSYTFKNPYKRFPKSFEDYKQMMLEEWMEADIPEKKDMSKWYVGDEWEETDDDPIEEPKDVEL